jgi:hypothetical protein
LLDVSAESLHIAIDVSVTGEQVCGYVSVGGRQPKPFSGWLELIVALDEILGGPPPQAIPTRTPARREPPARHPSRRGQPGPPTRPSRPPSLRPASRVDRTRGMTLTSIVVNASASI